MKQMPVLVKVVRILALCACVLASYAAAQAEPVYGGTLTIAYTSTSPHIDIQGTNQGSLSESAHYMYETLFDRNPDGDIEGLLVRDFSVSEGGLVYTFELQPDVLFHDGTPFDAEAVKYNFERKINLQLPNWDSIPWDSIDVVDALTIQVTLTNPAPHILNVLAAKTWSMYSPTHVEAVGVDGVLSEGVGTGPFMQENFEPNTVLHLVRNPNYWQEGLPYLDEVIFRVIPDANTRAALLEAGDVDMALGLPVPVTERLRFDDRFNVLSALGSRQYYITMNNLNPPLDDVLVRRAINHAVDKEGILQAVFLGVGGEVANAVYLNPTVTGYSPAGNYAYDPEQAEALLEEAGWVIGDDGVRVKEGETLSITLHTRRGSTTGDFETAELVQGMLADVGIDVELVVLESASFVSAVTMPSDQAEYYLVNLTVGTITGDAEYIMTSFYHSDSAAPRLYNRAYYGNPEVDALIEESRLVGSREERDAIYEEVIQMVFDDAPILQLFDTVAFLAVNADVQGIYFEPAYSNWPAKYAWKVE